jgi:hypothetical protein
LKKIEISSQLIPTPRSCRDGGGGQTF